MIVLDYLVHSHIVLASKSVKLLRLELYGNDIYTSIRAIIRRYRTIVSLLMIVNLLSEYYMAMISIRAYKP